ncbi:hypoxanthine phosphoribosyltransferase [Lacticaseibacillus brantae]|uniref:Hypoxanthine phosphoribosyltransferase n=1 Tax=Lacticaseibacillus brantae DSM 23927 TaxID=1423727 RepID=A0A0R2AXN5_9LACO|nr:hypoxanthine phosphoribosyltransferase [Lacticaseibacillus brantae]KRM71234.1 hypoxanthine phosphoribosyltransferase [Lacticaseibacillus brantae DSM 23927]
MNPDILKVLYSREDIQAINARLAAQIKADYAGKNPLVVCILKGAILFMTDLVREIDDYLEIDFMDVSSYGDATISSGEVKIIKDLDTSVRGRDVLIVEDIVDTGRTLRYLMDMFQTRQANSIKVCTLMDKPEGRVVDVSADYVGTKVPNEFVVGYGLDYAERYRNLPYIGVLKPEVYAK